MYGRWQWSRVCLFISVLAVGLPSISQGQSSSLVITEVMWDSSHPASNAAGIGGYANDDWWELLNAGDIPIDMTGFRWDDDDRLAGDDYTIFPPFTLQPSELVIILREPEGSVDRADGFRDVWGLPPELRILSESFFADTGSGDTFSGLSSGGDEVNLYDAEGELLVRFGLDVAVPGHSRALGFINGTWDDLGISEVGDFGARLAASDGSGQVLSDPSYLPLSLDVGSPGEVAGFTVIFPGVPQSIDSLCGQVSRSELSLADFNALLDARGVLGGDADQDGSVAFADFLRLAANFGLSDHSFSGGDFDCDGNVAFADFLILSANFGQTGRASLAAVPEPVGLGMMTWSTWWLAAARRRQGKK